MAGHVVRHRRTSSPASTVRPCSPIAWERGSVIPCVMLHMVRSTFSWANAWPVSTTSCSPGVSNGLLFALGIALHIVS